MTTSNPARQGLRPRSSPLAAAAIAALLQACSGSVVGDDDPVPIDPCADGNAAPATPTVASPAAGSRDVFPGEVVLASSAFVDPDGDAQIASAWEIWQVAGDAAVQKVWAAEVDDPDKLTRVTLADGAFVVGDGLAQDQRYQLQVRHRSDAGCTSWSEWSEPLRFTTEDGSAAFFAEDQIRDLYLDIPQASWDAIDAAAYPPGCVPYERESYAASMTFEGVEYPGIGLKVKGGCGSARGLGGKASFKIDLEWSDPAAPQCPARRRLHGLNHLTLQNNVQDRSYVHQVLAYELYRAMGVPAPRANYMRVHVNGELWGLYTNLETADRRFLGRWFPSSDGMMYEGTYYCDLVPSSVPRTDDHEGDTDQCLGREFATDACSSPDPGADPTDYGLARQLVTQIEALSASGDFYPGIEQFVDYDSFLSLWAVDALINNWDGFVYRVMNNYRIYHEPTSRAWTVVPSGTDQTFTTNEAHSAFGVNNVLARRCLDDAACKAAFAGRLQQALDVFAAADLVGRTQELRARIAADVQADPRREFGYDNFEGAIASTVQFLEGRAAVVAADLADNGF